MPRQPEAVTAKSLPDGAARARGRAGLTLAGVALAWALATWAGGALGWPERWRALLDLFALAGFGLALWMTYAARRQSRAPSEGRDA